MKQLISALIWFGLGLSAYAQAPAPVPALPDSARLTTYSISASTCACSVGFQIYGTGTDVDEWISVYINGVVKLSTDPTFGWSLSSVTGPLGSIPRPITNAVLTFNTVQTATVIILGNERPRRLSQFPENRGVAARDLNQAITDAVAVQRELWDKSNRSITGQPGEVLPSLPGAASRPGTYLCFDSSGMPIVCQIVQTGVGVITVPGSAVNGDSVCFNGTTGASFSDCNWKITGTPGGIGSMPVGSGSGTASWQNAPTGVSPVNPVWWGADPTGVADSTAAFNSALAVSTNIFFPPGTFKFNSQISVSLAAGVHSLKIACAGQDNTILNWPSTNGIVVTYADGINNSTHIDGCTFTTGAANTSTGLTLTYAGASSSPANAAPNDIMRSTFRGSDGYAATNLWNVGIKITSVSNVNLIGVYVVGGNVSAGYANAATSGTGLSLAVTTAAAVAINVIGSTFDYLTTGILYGTLVQGLTVANSNFTGDSQGIVVPVAANVTQLSVTASQFNNAISGIVSNTPAGAVSISGSLFFVSATSGFGIVLSQYAQTMVSGNNIFCTTPASTNGLVFTTAAATAESTVYGNVITGCSSGMVIGAAANQLLVSNNNLLGNTVGLTNSGTGNFIVNNAGYNPVGYTAGTSTGGVSGGAAGIVTSGSSPETHYIFQSLNFNAVVAKCTALACGTSTNICTVPSATVPCVLQLGPNETYKVTWATTQPTYTKDIH